MYTVSNQFMKKYGITEGVVMQTLLNMSEHYNENWVEVTSDILESELGLSYYKQKQIFDKLHSLDFIDVSVQGLPAKRYIRIKAKYREVSRKLLLRGSRK